MIRVREPRLKKRLSSGSILRQSAEDLPAEAILSALDQLRNVAYES